MSEIWEVIQHLYYGFGLDIDERQIRGYRFMLSLSWRLKLAGLIVVSAGAAFGIYWSMACHCNPGFGQERDRAMAQAKGRLQTFSQSFSAGSSLPVLIEDRYDANRNWWIFTFKNEACAIIVIVDCCGVTDIGGTNGCPPK